MSDKEFVRFLYIAQASCSEVKSMLHLANRLNYLDNETTGDFVENTNEIGKIIRGLIKSLSNKN